MTQLITDVNDALDHNTWLNILFSAYGEAAYTFVTDGVARERNLRTEDNTDGANEIQKALNVIGRKTNLHPCIEMQLKHWYSLNFGDTDPEISAWAVGTNPAIDDDDMVFEYFDGDFETGVVLVADQLFSVDSFFLVSRLHRIRQYISDAFTNRISSTELDAEQALKEFARFAGCQSLTHLDLTQLEDCLEYAGYVFDAIFDHWAMDEHGYIKKLGFLDTDLFKEIRNGEYDDDEEDSDDVRLLQDFFFPICNRLPYTYAAEFQISSTTNEGECDGIDVTFKAMETTVNLKDKEPDMNTLIERYLNGYIDRVNIAHELKATASYDLTVSPETAVLSVRINGTVPA